ncbi:hypothetical protein [Plantibacter sp. RU18]
MTPLLEAASWSAWWAQLVVLLLAIGVVGSQIPSVLQHADRPVLRAALRSTALSLPAALLALIILAGPTVLFMLSMGASQSEIGGALLARGWWLLPVMIAGAFGIYAAMASAAKLQRRLRPAASTA